MIGNEDKAFEPRMVADKSAIAEGYCNQVKGMLKAVCQVLDNARHDGIDMQFTVSPDQNGRSQPTVVATQFLARS